jgi:hypothetical protein
MPPPGENASKALVFLLPLASADGVLIRAKGPASLVTSGHDNDGPGGGKLIVKAQ